MTSTIQKFPTELLVLIFKSLNLTDIETCLKTCMKWREIIAQFILQTSLKKLSKFDENLYNQFCGYGWFQDYFNDTELIISLYEKTFSNLDSNISIQQISTQSKINGHEKNIRNIIYTK